MKKIIMIMSVALGVCMLSCDKDSGDNGHGTADFRVKRISGSNARWGEFELLFLYTPDGLLERAWRRNTVQPESKRDTLGRMDVSYQNSLTSMSLYDYVLNIDADSLAKLIEEYPTNYSDSLRRRRVARLQMENVFYKDENTVILTQMVPPADFGAGDDFSTRYKNLCETTSMLEYDTKGRIIVIRRFVNTYAQNGLNADFETTIDKYEFSYSGDGPTAGNYYLQSSYVPDSWLGEGSWQYSYSDGRPMSIIGDGYTWERSGATLTITEAGAVTHCTLDDNGNVTGATLPDGSQIMIEYEPGRGNAAELLYSPDQVLMGKNLIK